MIRKIVMPPTAYPDNEDGPSNMPLARSELLELANKLEDEEYLDEYAVKIRDIVWVLLCQKMQAKPTARVRQRKLTRELVEDILADFRKNTSDHNRRIGRRHGVDGARVSEIINGHRTPEHPEGTPEWLAQRAVNRRAQRALRERAKAMREEK